MADVDIRIAGQEDLVQIHDIFAYYVHNTTTSLWHASPPFSVIKSKYDTAADRGLPYLVAVDNTSEVDSRGLVVGYAYAAPFRGPLIGYVPSVEISIFVRHSHTRCGVGAKLISRLIEDLKTTVHCAVEPGHEDAGVTFPVRNVFAVMAQDVDGPGKQTGEKLVAWYVNFGFEVVARLRNVGFKDGRWVDTLYLQLDLGMKELK